MSTKNIPLVFMELQLIEKDPTKNRHGNSKLLSERKSYAEVQTAGVEKNGWRRLDTECLCFPEFTC